MVTVGYGDISPNTSFERLCSILTVLSACGVFAYSISEVGNIFLEMNKSFKKRKRNMFIINNYMKKKRITSDLQYQIRHYLEYYWNESLSENSTKEQDIINQLSNNLKENLMIEANKILVLESPFFRDNFSFKTILKTVSIVSEQRCTPEEIVYLEGDIDDAAIYFIEKGSVQFFHSQDENDLGNKDYLQCNILRAGEYFGEKSFFTGKERSQNIRSLEFTTLIKIERNKFLEVINESALDYEKFCLIKDEIMLNNNIKYTQKKCPFCKNEDYINSYHSPEECSMVHYIPNKQRIQDKFRLKNTIQTRDVLKRKNSKNFNSLGRIEQVRGDQNRMLFQFENVITEYMYINGIQKDNEDDDEEDELDELTNSTSSYSSDNENKIKEQENDTSKKIEESALSQSDSDSSSSSQNTSSILNKNNSPIKKKSERNRFSKDHQKSIVIEEDLHESESLAVKNIESEDNYKSKSQISSQFYSDNENIEIMELSNMQEIDSKIKIEKQQDIFNVNFVKSFVTNTMKKTTPTLPETDHVLYSHLTSSDIGTNSHNNMSCSQNKTLYTTQITKGENSFDQLDRKQFSICNFVKQKQASSSERTIKNNIKVDSFSIQDLKVNLFPVSTRQKHSSSITQSVKFKLPIKNHKHRKSRSLQEINRQVSEFIKVSDLNKKNQHSLSSIPNIISNNILSNKIRNKSNSYQNQIQQRSLVEIKKTFPLLKRMKSKGQENFKRQNSKTIQFENGDRIDINSNQQTMLNNQFDTLVNKFQKISDILANQNQQNFQTEQNKLNRQQTAKEDSSSLNQFDKMKLFEIYFPQNNYDMVINEHNQRLLSQIKKKSFRNTILLNQVNYKYSLHKNSILSFNQQTPKSSQQQKQVIQELFQQNTLNRLKYLKNDKVRKNSITEQAMLQSRSKQNDSNKNGDNFEQPQSPKNKKNGGHLTASQEDENTNIMKSQTSKQLKESNSNGNQHLNTLQIPNYFGLIQATESQTSFTNKKSRFGNRTSIFKSHDHDQSNEASPIQLIFPDSDDHNNSVK